MDCINIAISKEQPESVIEYNFIVWANREANKIIGVTFDKIKGQEVRNRKLLLYLTEKITASGLPLLLIEHDFYNNDIEVVDCSTDKSCKYKIDADQLEELILKKFVIDNSFVRRDIRDIKAVNVRERVCDGFHTWSRSAFGAKVKKVDIDCLLFKDHIRATIEVKNTSRSQIPIEKWQPYPDDQYNYKIIGLFSEHFLNCDFITLQHTLKHGTERRSADINVGLWKYDNELNFTQFRSDTNRKKVMFSQVINYYIEKDD
jgi:hypothetical protein